MVSASCAMHLDPVCAGNEAEGTLAGQHDSERASAGHIPVHRIRRPLGEPARQFFAVKGLEIDGRQPRAVIHAVQHFTPDIVTFVHTHALPSYWWSTRRRSKAVTD